MPFICLTGCQTVSKATHKVGNMIGLSQEDVPQANKKGVVDVSDSNISQLEQLTENLPNDQWSYIENKKQDIYNLKNKTKTGDVLSLKLNCNVANQKPTFSIENSDGQVVLKAYDEQAGQIQFLLDNKNYGNIFGLGQAKQLAAFKTQVTQAKVIKIYNKGKLYSFNNHKAELLSKPVSCRTNSSLR
ncbi:hypothetical protein [Acinetobacter sp. MB5]|uniref:hypothetical protein n=1 Tax=Acinetobacter sp. MB5 TaxID=2069438 RepID=UPI000DD021A5|nr:hypothetical protein [Acinetobacter sp. MB5]